MQTVFPPADTALLDRVRSLIELLERVNVDRAILNLLTAEDRERFHRAVADVYNPDPVARRRMVKAAERELTAAQIERAEATLRETGIRMLRRKPVYTT